MSFGSSGLKAVIAGLPVRGRISDNYRYNLMCLDVYDVMTFNIMIEVDRVDGYPHELQSRLSAFRLGKLLGSLRSTSGESLQSIGRALASRVMPLISNG